MSRRFDWRLSAREVLETGPVIPVVVVRRIEEAVPLARALLNGGIRTLEITLRSESALAAITAISREVPEMLVGAGTVLSPADLREVAGAGAGFAISPGGTPSLLEAAAQGGIPLIPGIATPSELMLGLEFGYQVFKFFPAEAAGGPSMLRSLAGPFPQARFCPTGGINPDNMTGYLQLANVICVGGSWLVNKEVAAAGSWEEVTRLARAAVTSAEGDRE